MRWCTACREAQRDEAPLVPQERLPHGRGSGLPSHREAGRHPLARFNRMYHRKLASLELACANHFVQVNQGGRTAAITHLATAEVNLVARDAELVEDRGNVVLVQTRGGNRNNVVVDG